MTMENKFCDPCGFDESEEKATGFCLDCVEYLCPTCSRDHRKNKITRTHNILKDEDMPSDVSSFTSMKTMTKCKTHPERSIEYKCSTHDELICVSCFAKSHRQCQIIEELTVQRTVKQLESVAQQMKRLKKEIHEVGDTCFTMKVILNENLIRLEKDCDQYAEGMKRRFDILNDKLKHDITSTINDQVSINEGDIDAISSLQNELGTHLKLVNDTQKYGSASEQEAVSRLTEHNLKRVECQVQSYQRKTSKLYKIVPNPCLEMLKDLGQIHELDEEEIKALYKHELANFSSDEVIDKGNKEHPEKDTTCSGSPDNLYIEEIHFNRNAILNYKSVDLNPLVPHSCAIASLDCLPDGRLLVLDDLNKRLMVFNSKIESVFCFSFRDKPINFCVQPTVDKFRQYVCVCFHGIKAVRYFVVNKDKLTWERGFSSRLQPVSVSPLGHETFVYYDRDSSRFSSSVNNIETRKITSQIVTTANITKEAIKVRVFEISGKHLVFSLERNIVSVYDIKTLQRRFSINLEDGEPTDLTVIKQYVYVCYGNINCVHKLPLSDMSKSKVIIENIEQPVALCYDKRSNRLFVGCRESPILHAFTLSSN